MTQEKLLPVRELCLQSERRIKSCVLLRLFKNSNDRSRMAKYVFVQNIKKKEDMKWWKNCAVAILRLVKSKQTFFHKEEENV